MKKDLYLVIADLLVARPTQHSRAKVELPAGQLYKLGIFIAEGGEEHRGGGNTAVPLATLPAVVKQLISHFDP